MYDVTDPTSFSAIDKWMQEIDEFASESAIKFIVGNKADASDRRKITFAQGKESAAHHHAEFLETSARTGLNVAALFQALSHSIIAHVLPVPRSLRGTDFGFMISS